jgi:DNA-binding PadR family transcriptional regulator
MPTLLTLAALGEFEQLVLLAALRAGDDAYGTRVLSEIRAAGAKHVSRGAVYVTLSRLERKGLLRGTAASAGPSQRGGRPRRYLRVTGEGLRALHSSRAMLVRLWSGLEATLGEAEG